jgi:hypothetical protein
MPHIPLVQVAIRLVSGYLSVPTVWGASVVMKIRMLFDDCGQDAFVDVTGRKVCLPKVRFFVVVVEVQPQRLRYLVVCMSWIDQVRRHWCQGTEKDPDLRCSQQGSQLKDDVATSEHFVLPPTSRSQGTRRMRGTKLSELRLPVAQKRKKLTWPHANMKSCQTRIPNS